MVETHANFDSRLEKLGKKHSMMTSGYATRVGRDGLITVQPRTRRPRNTNAFTVLSFLTVGFFFFKAFMVSASGSATYSERLEKLEGGTMVERAGATLLAIDPITENIATVLGPVLR